MTFRTLSLIFVTASCGFAGTIDAALNKTVTVTAGTVNGASAALTTLVDGIFRPEGIVWTSGTVYWTGNTTTIQVDLGAAYLIDGAIVQADNNDVYRLEYFSGTWQTAWQVPTCCGGGMRTRPNANQTTQQAFGPVNAQLWRISAVSGDSSNSLSEIQLFTNPVAPATTPEPSTFILLAGALGVLGVRKFRRQRV